LFIHSCNSDYEQISPSLTRADELVASTEFQEFQETTEHFAESLRKKYVKLSKSDQDQFVKTLSKLSDPNIENSKELLEKANSIIGTNLELEQKKIREKSSF